VTEASATGGLSVNPSFQFIQKSSLWQFQSNESDYLAVRTHKWHFPVR